LDFYSRGDSQGTNQTGFSSLKDCNIPALKIPGMGNKNSSYFASENIKTGHFTRG
jgi:hypothetical protein